MERWFFVCAVNLVLSFILPLIIPDTPGAFDGDGMYRVSLNERRGAAVLAIVANFLTTSILTIRISSPTIFQCALYTAVFAAVLLVVSLVIRKDLTG